MRAGRLATRGARKFYKYRVYEHPKRGLIYRLFTDSPQGDSNGPDMQYIARTSGGGLRLAAEFSSCLDCMGSGKQGRKRCGTCSGQGAIPYSSSAKRWTTLGAFVEEVFVEEPQKRIEIYNGPTADW